MEQHGQGARLRKSKQCNAIAWHIAETKKESQRRWLCKVKDMGKQTSGGQGMLSRRSKEEEFTVSI